MKISNHLGTILILSLLAPLRVYASTEMNQGYKETTETVSDAKNSDTIKAKINFIEEMIFENGLNKDNYPFEELQKLETSENNDALRDELLHKAYLRLAQDLHGDNVHVKNYYTGWIFHRAPLDIPAQISAAETNGTVKDFIASLVPKNPAYEKLQMALRSYRIYAEKGEWPHIDLGAALMPKDRNPRISQLRFRLEAEDYLEVTPTNRDLYDENLEKAVIAYQLRNGLKLDGHIGNSTLEALNIPLSFRIEQILANMERWRQMPNDFPPERFTEVNIADASIVIVEGGKEIYRGPVVIGQIKRKTPFIQSRIRSMIVNPSWHVPPKIAQKDILPKLKKNPHYLEELGFIISGNDDDPYGNNIDWKSMSRSEFNYRLRQAPGDLNSLGHLKFDFDNSFAVYMHDTPHHELFDKAQRNFSSGCIRLRDPEQVAEILLAETPGDWNAEKIDAEIDSEKTHWVAIKNPMPLYVLYWSVFADESGAINFRKDAYDYDRVLEPNYAPPKEEAED